MRLTVIIHTYNEEQAIASCIASAKLLSKDIVLVDMNSTDKTRSIARRAGARVTTFPFSRYVEPARSYGIKKAAGADWVFILDADEHITKALAQEIPRTLATTPHSHFRIKRKNIFGRRAWLAHGGWWPDTQIRLIHTADFVSWPTRIHSTPEIRGSMGFMQSPMLHFFHNELSGMVQKTAIYEAIEATLLYEAKRPVATKTFMRKYVGELYRRLFQHMGFLDGSYGVIESIYQAYSKTITWLLLYEKRLRV
ncbi:MAG: glycosyltransferase family 2 protein [Candidatus Roizmanbacteria bacterium]|nr:glycosyltransferase family 2 protein [Candidatus Roizmanbacteria bacterium]